MANGKLPAFINHLESGTVTLESEQNIWIPIPSIAMPKGILVYNNNFDYASAKADKTLGAYGALYIAGSDELTLNSYGYYPILGGAFYMIDWGTSTNYPMARASRGETRGVRFFNPQNRSFYFCGFGTGDYDFKNNVTYNWMAWD